MCWINIIFEEQGVETTQDAHSSAWPGILSFYRKTFLLNFSRVSIPFAERVSMGKDHSYLWLTQYEVQSTLKSVTFPTLGA